jgi:hypothetical protein
MVCLGNMCVWITYIKETTTMMMMIMIIIIIIINSLFHENPSNVKIGHWITEKKLFLSAFTKLRKAIISFVMSICPSVGSFNRLSVRMEQLGSYWTDIN